MPDDTAARWNADGAQLGLLTNPHAPSGALFSLEAIEHLAESFQGVLLIDEAYVDIVDPALNHDATQLLARHPNILLLRTLSKGYALAGLRMAYGLGAPGLVGPMLAKTKDSYNVDAIAQRLGQAALEDRVYAKNNWESVRNERARLSRALKELGFDVEPSQTNFLLATASENGPCGTALDLHKRLQSSGIHVRWFVQDRLRHSLRISIGTAEENRALLDAIHRR